MSKILLVGDLHVQQSNLEDTGEIFGLIDQILGDNQAISIVCFLGDIFHNHDIVRQEPAFFVWEKIATLREKYAERIDWLSLAGNHDYSSPSASSPENAVRLVLGDQIRVIDRQLESYLGMDFIPFVGSNDKFIQQCSESKNNILFCHQTFDGSKYENNQTAPDGVNQNKIPHKTIISGHIHLKQILKNSHNEVIYVGTPRALTSNEVNQKKYLTVFDPISKEMDLYCTDHLVKQFVSFEINQGDENVVIKPAWKAKDDVRIHVNGNQEFYDKVLEANADLAGQVRFIPNIRKELSRVLDIDSGTITLDEALYTYVHEVVDMSDELRKEVWMKLQTLMPQLGTNL